MYSILWWKSEIKIVDATWFGYFIASVTNICKGIRVSRQSLQSLTGGKRCQSAVVYCYQCGRQKGRDFDDPPPWSLLLTVEWITITFLVQTFNIARGMNHLVWGYHLSNPWFITKYLQNGWHSMYLHLPVSVLTGKWTSCTSDSVPPACHVQTHSLY